MKGPESSKPQWLSQRNLKPSSPFESNMPIYTNANLKPVENQKFKQSHYSLTIIKQNQFSTSTKLQHISHKGTHWNPLTVTALQSPPPIAPGASCKCHGFTRMEPAPSDWAAPANSERIKTCRGRVGGWGRAVAVDVFFLLLLFDSCFFVFF